VALEYAGVEVVRRLPHTPLVVRLLPLEPPPAPVELPTKPAVDRPPTPRSVVAPPSVVKAPTAPVTVEIARAPEPVAPIVAKAATVASVPPALVNLDTRLLSAEPPRYPVESRRRRETGTVVLLVVVDEEGRVSAISVAESSGSDRLDKVALAAVRRWRWSATVIEGRPSKVRGLVRIPFELRER